MRGKKIKIRDITNYKNNINFGCDKCGYVCHGKKSARLHLKYTHGVEKNIVTEQFCMRCNKIFYGSVSEHMIQHRK